MRYFGWTFAFLLFTAHSSPLLVKFVLFQVKTLAGLLRIRAAGRLPGQQEIKMSRPDVL